MFSRRVITASRQVSVLLRMRAPHCSLLVTVWCLVSGLLLLLGGLLALFLFTPLVNLIIQNKADMYVMFEIARKPPLAVICNLWRQLIYMQHTPILK